MKAEHEAHAWHLLWTLLDFYTLKRHFESHTYPILFSGLTESLFQPLPAGSPSPQTFSFTIRDLLEEGFAIEPTNDKTEHLVLNGRTIKVFILSVSDATSLLGYDDNKAAK